MLQILYKLDGMQISDHPVARALVSAFRNEHRVHVHAHRII